jgi:hypothetical protein
MKVPVRDLLVVAPGVVEFVCRDCLRCHFFAL